MLPIGVVLRFRVRGRPQSCATPEAATSTEFARFTAERACPSNQACTGICSSVGVVKRPVQAADAITFNIAINSCSKVATVIAGLLGVLLCPAIRFPEGQSLGPRRGILFRNACKLGASHDGDLEQRAPLMNFADLLFSPTARNQRHVQVQSVLRRW